MWKRRFVVRSEWITLIQHFKSLNNKSIVDLWDIQSYTCQRGNTETSGRLRRRLVFLRGKGVCLSHTGICLTETEQRREMAPGNTTVCHFGGDGP